MNIIIAEELWLTDSDGSLLLGHPTVLHRLTGAGVPALVTPRPLRVFRPGEVVMLTNPPACGCTTILRYDSGAEVLQHTCGRGW